MMSKCMSLLENVVYIHRGRFVVGTFPSSLVESFCVFWLVSQVTLERILGLTCLNSSSLAVCKKTGYIAYPAG